MPVVQIQLLGGVSAATDSGAAIDVGPAKCQALLAALALSPGAAVSVSRLVELVWAEDPPRTAEKTLQSYVTRLRRELGHESIDRVGAAYRINVAPDHVDVGRFQLQVGRGDIAGALAEWNGIPLQGLDAPGMSGVVDGLIEQWLGLTEAELAQRVESDPGAAVADLTQLTSTHPFREELWGLLMTALYRSGRQADALAAYRRARNHLIEELGVEPGPRLRDLEAQILGQDDRLVPPRAGNKADAPIPTGTVTFGFTEIDGASRLWADDRASMSNVIRRHDDLVQQLARSHGGFVFSTSGDSFGVAFDRAATAAAWATELHAAMSDESWYGDIDLHVRIGLHTGEAEERATNYYGPAVNIAARIAASANGGQTLVSQVGAALLQGVDHQELGVFRFDGLPGEQPLFQLGNEDHGMPRTGRSHRGNLPRRSARLVGREDEIDAVTEAIDEHPLVTLVGPGGIGKTTLGLAAARIAEVGTADGAWIVELADVSSSVDVARTVAEALDVSQGDGQPVIAAIVGHLRERSTLVMLDNCEHVVDGVAELATEIVQACPAVTLLATSREGLGVPSEQLVTVGPLDLETAAIELFITRASAADPGFAVRRDDPSVAELCRRLDGVPLALELAAAQVRSLSPADLVARLDDRLRILTGGRRRSVERHRTLRATIQWSYDLLTPDEQVLFRRLSIFSGSFDLGAAEEVASDEDLSAIEISEVLGALVDRSMVIAESGAYGRRFRLLETMRQFGAELLGDAGRTHALAARHAAHVRSEVERISELLASNSELDGAAQLAELWPNVRAAVDWALGEQQRELASALIGPIAFQLFVRRGLGEILDWAVRLLEITPPDDQETAAWCVFWASLGYSMTQRRDEFRQMVARSNVQDHLLVRYACLFMEDEDGQARELGPVVVEEMRRSGYDNYARIFEMFTAASHMMTGSLEYGRAEHERIAEQFRRDGPPSFLNWTLYLLGASAAFEGKHELADQYWDEIATIEVPPRTNSPNEMLSARAAFRQGRRQEAYEILGAYVDELVDSENLAGVAMLCIEFMNMMVPAGRLIDAAVIAGHLDATGLLSVEGPGFWLLVTDSVEAVDADPAASAERQKAADRNLDEAGALAHIRQVLNDLATDV